MNANNLANWLKLIVLGMGCCMLGVYFYVIPEAGHSLVVSTPEYSYAYRPWLYLIWSTGIPCGMALYHGWCLACTIQKDELFIEDNVKHLRAVSYLSLFDGIYFAVMNIVYVFAVVNHFGIILISWFLLCVAFSISVVFRILAYLISRASELKLQSDATI